MRFTRQHSQGRSGHLRFALVSCPVALYNARHDLEDRYETRLRAMIDAKLKGDGVKPEEEPAEARGNVIDLMAALKKSLGETPEAPKQSKPRTAPAKQPTKEASPDPGKKAAAQAAAKSPRKRA